MYKQERYYTDEEPIKTMEDIEPATFKEIKEETKEIEEKPKSKPKRKVSTKKKETKTVIKETKERKFHKNLFIVVVVQSPETKINGQGDKVPVDPIIELKSILVEDHETFKDVMAKYEKLPSGFMVGNDFYPLNTKGDIVRMVELTQEEIAELSEKVKKEIKK